MPPLCTILPSIMTAGVALTPSRLISSGSLDLDDLDLDVQGPRGPFDDADGAAALAATRSQNFDFHLDGLVLEFIRQLAFQRWEVPRHSLARVHRFDATHGVIEH